MKEIKFECETSEFWKSKCCDKNCKECKAFIAKLSYLDITEYEKQVRNNTINEFYNLLINNTGEISDVGGVISEQRIDALYEQMKRH